MSEHNPSQPKPKRLAWLFARPKTKRMRVVRIFAWCIAVLWVVGMFMPPAADREAATPEITAEREAGTAADREAAAAAEEDAALAVDKKKDFHRSAPFLSEDWLDSRPAEERHKGFHCLSDWDGSHRMLGNLYRHDLKDPGSFEHIETRITPVAEDGTHWLWMDYRASNSYGFMVNERVAAIVQNDDCTYEIAGVESLQ